MGLFDNSEKESREEVRVSVPEEKSGSRKNTKKSRNNRLKSEVESKVSKGGSNERRISGSSKTSSKSVDLEDIHRQNQRIIELLEQISDKDSSNNKRVTDRKDDRKDTSDVGSGMNELL